jgi:hypothetical protein
VPVRGLARRGTVVRPSGDAVRPASFRGDGVNDSDTLTLVAQAITDVADHPLHRILAAWLTSIEMRGQHVCDVDRDYALAAAHTFLQDTP